MDAWKLHTANEQHASPGQEAERLRARHLVEGPKPLIIDSKHEYKLENSGTLPDSASEGANKLKTSHSALYMLLQLLFSLSCFHPLIERAARSSE